VHMGLSDIAERSDVQVAGQPLDCVVVERDE
jgi:hypothetical protein